MNSTINEIQRLLFEVGEHANAKTTADKRKAVEKLFLIANLSTTLAFTIKMGK